MGGYEIYIVIWIVCGIGAFLIAQNRGATNAPTWFLVGVLLGPLGIMLAAISAKRGKTNRDDTMATLQGLAQMRADGSITEAEYEEKKRTLLARI